MAAKKKRGRGRPKGSTVRGQTVQVSIRVPKDLFDEIEAVRKRAEESLSRTIIVERLVRTGLKQMRARSPLGPKS